MDNIRITEEELLKVTGGAGSEGICFSRGAKYLTEYGYCIYIIKDYDQTTNASVFVVMESKDQTKASLVDYPVRDILDSTYLGIDLEGLERAVKTGNISF